MQAVCIALQREFVECIDIVFETGEVEVQHCSRLVVLVLRAWFAAGAQQIHWQGLNFFGQ